MPLEIRKKVLVTAHIHPAVIWVAIRFGAIPSISWGNLGVHSTHRHDILLDFRLVVIKGV